jgi:hypothetical protein
LLLKAYFCLSKRVKVRSRWRFLIQSDVFDVPNSAKTAHRTPFWPQFVKRAAENMNANMPNLTKIQSNLTDFWSMTTAFQSPPTGHQSASSSDQSASTGHRSPSTIRQSTPTDLSSTPTKSRSNATDEWSTSSIQPSMFRGGLGTARPT